MRRERDNQRKKVYRAENEAFNNKPYILKFDDLKQVDKFLKRIFKSKWFQKKFPNFKNFIVKYGRSRTRACGWSSGDCAKMKLPVWTRNNWIVLHELSHGLVFQGGNAFHDMEYCKVYLELVKKWIGKDAANDLKVSFKKHLVKYKPKRIISEARKLELVERMKTMHNELRAFPMEVSNEINSQNNI